MPNDWQTIRDRLGLTLRPIDEWPGKRTHSPDSSPFRASLNDTLKVLERELRMLSARNIVLQIAFREGAFRQDGLPRMDARVEHPGVILAFESKHGALRVHMDRFRNYADNLRAIALHLENLRHASLYGVGTDGQQYRGWMALPESTGGNSGEEIIRSLAGCGSDVSIKEAYRLAVRKHHPDSGGSRENWDRLENAWREISK